MKLPHLKLRKLYLKVFAVLSLTALFGGVLLSASDLPVNASTSLVPAAVGLQDELQIQLGENGFSPAEVQHVAGTFGIAVENANLEGEYTLRLKAADGTVLKEVQVQKGSAAWTMTLAGGEYTLTEANHSTWLCRISVQ